MISRNLLVEWCRGAVITLGVTGCKRLEDKRKRRTLNHKCHANRDIYGNLKGTQIPDANLNHILLYNLQPTLYAYLAATDDELQQHYGEPILHSLCIANLTLKWFSKGSVWGIRVKNAGGTTWTFIWGTIATLAWDYLSDISLFRKFVVNKGYFVILEVYLSHLHYLRTSSSLRILWF